VIELPVFQIESLADALAGMGYPCRVGALSDVRPERRPYFEQWLEHRDGFITMERGNVDYVGIEEVVRMGPFFNVYCLVENGSVADNDENAHNLLDASPYYQLAAGRAKDLGWSGGVLSSLLAHDGELTQELVKNITREEVRRISVRARNYCCVIETGVWDPSGLASVFGVIDRIAMHVRKLLAQVHFGERMNE
jgi:hypothetical protein